MARSIKLPTKQFLAVLGLASLCTTASLAASPVQNGLEGSMTAYPIDGVYKGTSQRIASATPSCSSGQEVALEVRDGRFQLPWQGNQVFDTKIRSDGTFYSTTVPAGQAEKHMTTVPTLQGQIGPSGLVADYGTRWCRYRLDASQEPKGGQRLSQRLTTSE